MRANSEKKRVFAESLHGFDEEIKKRKFATDVLLFGFLKKVLKELIFNELLAETSTCFLIDAVHRVQLEIL